MLYSAVDTGTWIRFTTCLKMASTTPSQAVVLVPEEALTWDHSFEMEKTPPKMENSWHGQTYTTPLVQYTPGYPPLPHDRSWTAGHHTTLNPYPMWPGHVCACASTPYPAPLPAASTDMACCRSSSPCRFGGGCYVKSHYSPAPSSVGERNNTSIHCRTCNCSESDRQTEADVSVLSSHSYRAPDPPTEVTVKIIVIGSSGVGKTSYIKRYVSKSYSDQYKWTVGGKGDCEKEIHVY